MVGGLLVTLAALGTFAAYTSASAGPTATIVVADRPLLAGQTIRAADLRTVVADLPDAVRQTLFPSTAELDGAVVLAPISSDQAITRSAVSTAPADRSRSRDLSFALERDRALNGRIEPGELIDLVATYGTGAEASTEIVARRVPVIAVDAPPGSSASSTAKITVTIGLEHEADVLRAANALEVAHVTLTRSTGIDPAAPAAEPFSPSDHAGTTGTASSAEAGAS